MLEDDMGGEKALPIEPDDIHASMSSVLKK